MGKTTLSTLKDGAKGFNQEEILSMSIEQFEEFVLAKSLRLPAKEFFNRCGKFIMREILELSLGQVSDEVWTSLASLRLAFKELGFESDKHRFLMSYI